MRVARQSAPFGLVAAALIGVLLAAGPAASAPAPVKSCGALGFTPGTEDGVANILAFRTTCRTARKVARASRSTSPRRGPYSYTTLGFRCRGRFVSPSAGDAYASWRCVKGAATVRFFRY